MSQFVHTDKDGMHVWTTEDEEWVRPKDRNKEEEKYQGVFVVHIHDGGETLEVYGRQMDALCAAWITWRTGNPDPVITPESIAIDYEREINE